MRTGVIPLGRSVEVVDVDVTGVWANGMIVQDPRGGARNAGIAVFSGGAPGVSVGDRVDVTGVLGDYFGELQIESTSITRIGSGMRVSPVAMSSTVASTDPYQGMLVKVSGTVTDTAYDCTIDGAGCTDTNLWEIGGSNGVVVFDRMYEDSLWTSHIGETPVVGVLTWRWERARLMPRTADDFGP